jgi:hypothetical protein
MFMCVSVCECVREGKRGEWAVGYLIPNLKQNQKEGELTVVWAEFSTLS